MKTIDDLIEDLNALADSLIGDDWNHPVTSVETCRRAARELERLKWIDAKTEDQD